MPSDSGSIRATSDVLLVLVFVLLATGAAIQPRRRTGILATPDPDHNARLQTKDDALWPFAVESARR
jgi:hypothetical protein